MKSKKILILDDDDDVLEILALLLSDAGYETKTSVNGETVFDDIANFQPNLILMDIVLRDVDGRAICQHIKQNHTTAHLPVILISGQHDLVEYMHLPGAPNDFVAKPFSINQLLAKVAQQVL